MTDQTMFAVFDKDEDGMAHTLSDNPQSAIKKYVNDPRNIGGNDWLEMRKQGYYAAPAKIVEVK